MKLLVVFLVGASAVFGDAVLTDDHYKLPPGSRSHVIFAITHRAAVVVCRFQTETQGLVRAELVTASNLALTRDALYQTDAIPAGGFDQYVEEPGQYAVVIQNPGSQDVAVHMSVALNFGPPQPVSRYLSPARRLTVILISCAMFFAIVTFSARALLRAMKR